MWHDIFISQTVINKAMQLVARQRAKGEVRNCLRAFLNWEKVRLAFTYCHNRARRSYVNVLTRVVLVHQHFRDIPLCMRSFKIPF